MNFKYNCLISLVSFVTFVTITQGEDSRNKDYAERAQGTKRSVTIDLEKLTTSALVELYEDVLIHQRKWVPEEFNKIQQEIIRRDDSSLDRELIAVFDRISVEEANRGRLNSLAGKRPLTRTEEVINLLARRKTRKAADFILSQATNPKVVIRAGVVTSIGANPSLLEQMDVTKLMPMLYDKEPEIAWRALLMFNPKIKQPMIPDKAFAEALIKGLVQAKNRTVLNGATSLVDCFHIALKDYRASLEKLMSRTTGVNQNTIADVIGQIDKGLAANVEHSK